jgi:hypothetical protein
MVFRSVWLGHLIKVAVDERVGEGGGHAQQVTHGEGDTEPDVTGAALLAENNVLSSCENMLCRGGRKRESERERDRERERVTGILFRIRLFSRPGLDMICCTFLLGHVSRTSHQTGNFSSSFFPASALSWFPPFPSALHAQYLPSVLLLSTTPA